MAQIRTELRQIQTEFSRLAIFYGGYPQVSGKRTKTAYHKQK